MGLKLNEKVLAVKNLSSDTNLTSDRHQSRNLRRQNPGPSRRQKSASPPSPKLVKRDPSLPSTLPTTSKPNTLTRQIIPDAEKKPLRHRILNHLYNREKKTYCDRTCKSWICIIGYSIIYIIFLVTYTMIFLYGSLMILKSQDFTVSDRADLLTYSERGVGITATPTSENLFPIICYRNGVVDDYEKYIRAIDGLLESSRRKNDLSNLGPCGQVPYGYGDKPCVLLRINRQWKWLGKPLQLASDKFKSAPLQVQEWLQKDPNKLWFYCNGYHSYDKEHIRSIVYYPYPPGIDPDLFPLDSEDISPLIAVQISNFTLGVSLAIECQMWYEKGPSSVEFVLYIDTNNSAIKS